MRRLRGSRSAVAAVVAAGTAALAGGALAEVPAPRQISIDPFTDALGQHETAVEPDSFSFGDTVVAVFQVGRMLEGGASGTGWASSLDGGRTWRSGILPLSGFSRTSDPVVAFDRVHGVWLANVLALRDLPGARVSSLVVSRSSDAASWSGPVGVSPEVPGQFTHDKNWIACDNGAASPHAGRCYVVWTRAQDGAMALSTSTDGGLTWSAATMVPQAVGSGWQPVVRQDGTLVVVYEGSASVEAVRSTDGGRTFGDRIRVSALRVAPVPGMRTPSLPSVEVGGDGALFAAWHDCRFRVGCETNDLVFASSQDGTQWSRTRRVPTARTLDGQNHFVAGLGVDSTTSGARTRLAVAFYVRAGTLFGPGLMPRFMSSADAGRTWSAVEVLAPPAAVDDFPNTAGGRFAGDYISTSFTSGGTAVPVFAWARSRPLGAPFDQGVFSTAIPPLPAVTRPVALGPIRVTRTRTRLSASAALTGDVFSPIVSCRLRGVRGRIVSARVVAGRATCVWSVLSRRGASGTIAVTTPESEASRTFSARGRWAAARGDYRTLVILATWGPQPWSAEEVRRTVFDDADEFYRRSSFGQVSLSGDVTPWLNAYPTRPVCPTPEHERVAPGLADPPQAAARAAGFDPASYARLIYVLPPRVDCPFNAVGVRREVLLNGVLSPWVVVHELGHTFELAHAYGTACDANGCRHDEYGDPFSPMGRGLVDFSAYEKVKLGWIRDVARAERPATYTVGRPDELTMAPHALVVPTGAGDYWLEQRLDVSPAGLVARRVERDIPDDDLEAPTRFMRDQHPTGANIVGAGGQFRVPNVFSVTYRPTPDGRASLELVWTDRTAPGRPTLLAPGRRVRAGRPVRVAWRATPDLGSGVAFCTLTVDRRIVTPARNGAPSTTIAALRRGPHTVAVTCTDRAGNRSRPATRRVQAAK